MAGRPTKYTPDTVKAITDAIRVGCTYRLACQLAGISDETFARWQARYVDFVEAIKKADAECVAIRLSRISQAGKAGTWQADAWVLERRYANEFGNRTRLDVNIRQEAERLAEQVGVSADELLAEAQRMMKEVA